MTRWASRQKLNCIELSCFFLCHSSSSVRILCSKIITIEFLIVSYQHNAPLRSHEKTSQKTMLPKHKRATSWCLAMVQGKHGKHMKTTSFSSHTSALHNWQGSLQDRGQKGACFAWCGQRMHVVSSHLYISPLISWHSHYILVAFVLPARVDLLGMHLWRATKTAD